MSYLSPSSLQDHSYARWEVSYRCCQQGLVTNAIFLEPIQKRSGRVLHLTLSYNDNTLEVSVDPRGFQMGSYGNVGIVTRTVLRVINPTEPLIEKVIETFMNIVSLTHHNCVTFNGRMTYCSYCVYLWKNRKMYIIIIKIIKIALKLKSMYRLPQSFVHAHCINYYYIKS